MTTPTTSAAPSGTVRADVLCRASLWNWLQDWLDSMASDGDRHDMRMGGGGQCWDDCPACTAAKLAKAMREEAQNGGGEGRGASPRTSPPPCSQEVPDGNG